MPLYRNKKTGDVVEAWCWKLGQATNDMPKWLEHLFWVGDFKTCSRSLKTPFGKFTSGCFIVKDPKSIAEGREFLRNHSSTLKCTARKKRTAKVMKCFEARKKNTGGTNGSIN